MNKNNPPIANLAIYIHWPFCKSKCPYCDFNSHVSEKIDQDHWQKAYIMEIEKFKDLISKHYISSIFFGGGTPSLMPPSTAGIIIAKLASLAEFSPDIEITLEANPTSFEAGKFRDFKTAGINRVSLGIQALNDADLKFLGREHSAKEAMGAINSAATIFDNYSFDLIYARPGQTTDEWQKELEMAVDLAAEHLSVYQLTIEKGTKFFSMYQQKKFVLPAEELALELFLATDEFLKTKNFSRYEVSNHAKNNKESKHNLSYWRYDQYLGIGPGAHSRIEGKAICQYYRPDKWLESALSPVPAIFQQEILSREQFFNEILLMGFRTIEGVQYSTLAKYVADYQSMLPETKLLQLQKEGLIHLSEHSMVLTNEGLCKINAILNFLFV